jgi:hypothetical protein
MAPTRPLRRFVLVNLGVWLAMTLILIALPDLIERWLPLVLARAVSWPVAGAVWVVAIERQWQQRMGALPRFFFQVLLWGSSALLASWVSDQFRA